MNSRYPLFPALCLGLLQTALAQAPLPTPDKAFPIQAALTRSLNATQLHLGDTILARVASEWTYGACRLASGSVLTGHVTALDLPSRTVHRTAVSLLFDASCGEATPLALTWIALLAPDTSNLAGLHDGNPVAVQALRSSTFGESGGIGRTGIGQGDTPDMSGHQNPNFPVFLGEAPDRTIPRPVAVKDGQVWRIPDLSLSVASGPLGSSTLSSGRHALHVPSASVLVLAPTRARDPLTSRTAPNAPRPDMKPEHLPPPAPEALLCSPPTCTIAPASTAAPANPLTPTQLLPLAKLGYGRLSTAEIRDLAFGAALAFLGPDHLLFTFDPRALVPRSPADRPEAHPHMVRAVLFNLHTGLPERTLDWRVNDSNQYLWPLAEDQVLVHAGNRLLWLGPGLTEIASLPLTGHLAFVRLSPDRTHIALGILHELHTREQHAELAELDANGPEEEVAVQILGSDRQPIGPETHQSSRSLPPILTNRGRLTLLHAGGEFWHYRETAWPVSTSLVASSASRPSRSEMAGPASPATDPPFAPPSAPGSLQSKTPAHLLARIQSACVPTAATLSPDLLFLVGCDHRSSDRWYRVLRPDGTLVLKGTLHSQDLPPLPLPDLSLTTFALALPATTAGYVPGSPFHAADLASETIRLLRAQDGQTLFAARTRTPAATRQPAATAPDAHHLAILDGDQIALYTVSP